MPREFTLEVNPATVTPEKAAAWRAAGVNRISLGAQSFDAEMLKVLGRQHAPGDIAETCALLREHGFDNINIDLMFALPSQAEAKWEETLQAALACAPQHISAYALTYEEDTPFFEKLQRGEWRQDEEREIAMFERTREVLAAAGFIDYEISNFAQTGFESQHNLGYWRGADYLGLGPSACSTIGDQRWRNVPDTRRLRGTPRRRRIRPRRIGNPRRRHARQGAHHVRSPYARRRCPRRVRREREAASRSRCAGPRL